MEGFYNFDNNFNSPLGILFNTFFDTMDGKYGDDLWQYSKSEWFLIILRKQIRSKWDVDVKVEDLNHLNLTSKYCENNIKRIDMFMNWLDVNQIPYDMIEYKLKLKLKHTNDKEVEVYLYQNHKGSTKFSGEYFNPYIVNGVDIKCMISAQLTVNGDVIVDHKDCYLKRKFIFTRYKNIGAPIYKHMSVEFIPYIPRVVTP